MALNENILTTYSDIFGKERGTDSFCGGTTVKCNTSSNSNGNCEYEWRAHLNLGEDNYTIVSEEVTEKLTVTESYTIENNN